MANDAFPIWRVSGACALAQRVAILSRMLAGGSDPLVRLYAGALPVEVGGGQSHLIAVPLSRTLSIVNANGILELHPKDTSGVMLLVGGQPRWGELVAGDGVVLADGTVTDADHGGCFRVSGGVTPEGDSTPHFYAGGILLLQPTVLV